MTIYKLWIVWYYANISMSNYNKILLPTRPQPDTIVGIFLLKVFGKSRYPGVENAAIDVLSELPKGETPESFEQKGILAIDLAGSKFDHHNRNSTASQLIAEDLGISNLPSISKLLRYAERDDKYGAGTISQDQLDRAFGLSGLIASLNKALPQDPEKVVNYVVPLLKAHYSEEKKRTEDLPGEFSGKIQSGKAELLQARHKGKNIKIALIESDSASINNWLRSSEGPKADVVVQKSGSGYVNITTRQMKRIDLRWPAALLRQEENNLRARGTNLKDEYLMRSGRIDEVPEWYYDRATNSILNGGIIHRGVEPTVISFALIRELVKAGLEVPIAKRKIVARTLPDTNAYFLEIRVPQDEAREIKNILEKLPDGMKAHLPENYHVTLMYLGKYHNDEVPELLAHIQSALVAARQFSISIEGKNFKAGIVPGYPQRSFYFQISDEGGGAVLREIWEKLRSSVPHFHEQEFYAHLTVATAMQNVDERVIENASMLVKEGARVDFPVEKIRLTQVIEAPGRVSYRKKQEFVLGG